MSRRGEAPPPHPTEAQARLMIEAKNITKTYGATVAVDNVSFTAHPGEIVGFLGPNGAGEGKSQL